MTAGVSYISNNFNHNKVGRFSFPNEAPGGQEYSNEFQLILPHTIKYSNDFKKQHNKNQYQTLTNYNEINSQNISTSHVYKFTSISPTEISNNDIVYVSYYTNKPHKKGDWIGVYSPSNVDITKTVPGETSSIFLHILIFLCYMHIYM